VDCTGKPNWYSGYHSIGSKWIATDNKLYRLNVSTHNGLFNPSGGAYSPYHWTNLGVCASASAPSVTTSNSSGNTSTTAYFNGNVTNDNGATVTSRGFKWGTTSNPTTNINVGSGTGTFSTNQTGLTPGQTYYFKAWATNSQGTTNGTVKSVVTNGPPVVGYSVDNVIPLGQVSQSAAGDGVITINFKVSDVQSNNVTLNTFEYSVMVVLISMPQPMETILQLYPPIGTTMARAGLLHPLWVLRQLIVLLLTPTMPMWRV
jgi:hypothetical protein